MARPLTALLVINRLSGGGAERSLGELLPQLERGGVRTIVACLVGASTDLAASAITAGRDVRIVRAREFATRSRDLRGLASAVRGLRTIIREDGPDLVHTMLFASDIAGRLASVGTRGPAVLTSLVGNTYVPERLADPNVTAMKLRMCRLADSWTGRAVNDHFHAISHAVKASAQAALKIPDEKISVIYRGRDSARLGKPSPARRAAARRMLDIEPDAEVLVNIARQEHRKGVATLLDAMPSLIRDRPRLVLVQAGRPGAASDDLRQRLAQRGLCDRVRLLGETELVPELLAAADVFVFPSLYEGLGGAVIEAMALGLPIVASDTPAMREILERDRNALLVPPANATELGVAIAQLLDDPARRQAFGERGQQLFGERFTLAHSAEQMLELYNQVVTRHREGPRGEHRR